MNQTRERILTLLKKVGPTTVAKISQITGMTKPNIHHHVKILEKEHYIEIKPLTKCPAATKGRPENYITLLPESCPDNLSHLADHLLELFFRANNEPGLHNLARALVDYLPGEANVSQKFNSTVFRLNQFNYQAQWEAHETGPRMMFKNCPYQKIINTHPELCLMDTYILENIFGPPVIQKSKINFLEGILFCSFIVRV